MSAATTAQAPESRFLAQYEEAEGAASSRLAELRRRGRDRFREVGFPGAREERWRFTRLTPVTRREFGYAVDSPGDGEHLRSCLGESPVPKDAIRAVFVNGRFAPGLSLLGEEPGIRVSPLGNGLADGLPEHLGEIAELEQHRFAALNTAFLHDAAVVRVGGSESPRPVHLLFLEDSSRPRASYPRVLVLLEPGAVATVVEEYRGTGGADTFSCSVSEVHLGENASLEHIRLQALPETAYHIGLVSARLSRDARLRNRMLSLGAALCRVDVDVFLDGEGAECDLDGLYIPRGTQHVDHHTRVEHRAPHTTSREHYKGVLDGKSTGVFNGRVVIQEGTSGIDAAQANHNLLLSERALVNTNPELEIFADDVKAQHGATVGRLDADQLFYLRSRGLGKDESRRLLIRAFCQEIVDRVGVPGIRESLEEELVGRF